jgi:hypothetical protein
MVGVRFLRRAKLKYLRLKYTHWRIIHSYCVFYFPICKNTISTAEYLYIVSKAVLLKAKVHKELTYAAVAPKVSNGFATVANETIQRNSTMNPVIQAKLITLLRVNSKIQSGAISIAKVERYGSGGTSRTGFAEAIWVLRQGKRGLRCYLCMLLPRLESH